VYDKIFILTWHYDISEAFGPKIEMAVIGYNLYLLEFVVDSFHVIGRFITDITPKISLQTIECFFRESGLKDRLVFMRQLCMRALVLGELMEM